MSSKAQAILNEIRTLAPNEQREISSSILESLVSLPPRSHRRSIADIAGKYRANPNLEAKDHDCGFAAAVMD